MSRFLIRAEFAFAYLMSTVILALFSVGFAPRAEPFEPRFCHLIVHPTFTWFTNLVTRKSLIRAEFAFACLMSTAPMAPFSVALATRTGPSKRLSGRHGLSLARHISRSLLSGENGDIAGSFTGRLYWYRRVWKGSGFGMADEIIVFFTLQLQRSADR